MNSLLVRVKSEVISPTLIRFDLLDSPYLLTNWPMTVVSCKGEYHNTEEYRSLPDISQTIVRELSACDFVHTMVFLERSSFIVPASLAPTYGTVQNAVVEAIKMATTLLLSISLVDDVR